MLVFFLRRYKFREVLAFSTSVFHLVRSLMQSFQFVIFILVMSRFTSSSHLFFGLPSDLVGAGDHSYTFFYHAGIRCSCPNQANLCALMWFMMFLLPVSLFSSSFDLIRHVPSLLIFLPLVILGRKHVGHWLQTPRASPCERSILLVFFLNLRVIFWSQSLLLARCFWYYIFRPL